MQMVFAEHKVIGEDSISRVRRRLSARLEERRRRRKTLETLPVYVFLAVLKFSLLLKCGGSPLSLQLVIHKQPLLPINPSPRTLLFLANAIKKKKQSRLLPCRLLLLVTCNQPESRGSDNVPAASVWRSASRGGTWELARFHLVRKHKSTARPGGREETPPARFPTLPTPQQESVKLHERGSMSPAQALGALRPRKTQPDERKIIKKNHCADGQFSIRQTSPVSQHLHRGSGNKTKQDKGEKQHRGAVSRP